MEFKDISLASKKTEPKLSSRTLLMIAAASGALITGLFGYQVYNLTTQIDPGVSLPSTAPKDLRFEMDGNKLIAVGHLGSRDLRAELDLVTDETGALVRDLKGTDAVLTHNPLTGQNLRLSVSNGTVEARRETGSGLNYSKSVKLSEGQLKAHSNFRIGETVLVDWKSTSDLTLPDLERSRELVEKIHKVVVAKHQQFLEVEGFKKEVITELMESVGGGDLDNLIKELPSQASVKEITDENNGERKRIVRGAEGETYRGIVGPVEGHDVPMLIFASMERQKNGTTVHFIMTPAETNIVLMRQADDNTAYRFESTYTLADQKVENTLTVEKKLADGRRQKTVLPVDGLFSISDHNGMIRGLMRNARELFFSDVACSKVIEAKGSSSDPLAGAGRPAFKQGSTPGQDTGAKSELKPGS